MEDRVFSGVGQAVKGFSGLEVRPYCQTADMSRVRIDRLRVIAYRNEREPCTDNPKMIPARELYADVLEVWLKWLGKGSPRDKDGNPKIPKQKEVKTA